MATSNRTPEAESWSARMDRITTQSDVVTDETEIATRHMSWPAQGYIDNTTRTALKKELALFVEMGDCGDQFIIIEAIRLWRRAFGGDVIQKGSFIAALAHVMNLKKIGKGDDESDDNDELADDSGEETVKH